MDIVMMRGTTLPIRLSITDGAGNPVILEGDEVIVFRIKDNPNNRNYKLQKILNSAYQVGDTNVYEFSINPSDTEDWEYGTYYYDYGIQFGVDDFRPCMDTAKFEVISAISGRTDSGEVQHIIPEDNSVSTAKIKNGAVTMAKLGSDVTPAALGAAEATHNHDTRYYTKAEVDDITAEATDETAGLMSAEDKEKLDGIDEGANAYILPPAAQNIFGGIRIYADGDTLYIYTTFPEVPPPEPR